MPVDFNRRFFRSVTFIMLVSTAAWAALGLGAFYFYTHKSLPQTKGTARAAGLQAPGVIIRDKLGIPHCYAENQNDLFYLAGYAQAQDRLFQMDLLRRTAAGRMAEWKGEKALGQDRLARAIGFARLAREQYTKLPPESRAVLDAFAEGVNAYALSGAQSLPIEYEPLRAKFEPWRPEDSLSVYLYHVYCATEWHDSLVDQAFQERGLSLLYHGSGDPWNAFFEGTPSMIGTKWTSLFEIDQELRNLVGTSHPNAGIASKQEENGKKTTKILMGLNSELTLPSNWYVMQLTSPSLEISGIAWPGFPMIISGSSSRIGFISWIDRSGTIDIIGKTTARGENTPTVILDCGQPPESNEISEKINVRGNRTEKMVVRQSVLTDALPQFKEPFGLYLRWAGLYPSDPVKTYLDFAGSSDAKSLSEAGKDSSENIKLAYISRDGRMGSLNFGLGLGPTVFPACISDESKKKMRLGDWGEVSDYSGDQLFFTGCGVASRDLISKFIGDGQGCYRIYRRVMEGFDSTSGNHLDALRDVHSNGPRYLKIFLTVLDKNRAQDPDLERVYLQMKDWNSDFDADSSAPLIFAETKRQARMLAYGNIISRELLFPLFDTLDEDALRYDNDEKLFLQALKLAIANLSQQYGPRMTQWKWGRAHVLKLRHPLGDEYLKGALKYFTLARPSPPMPGGRDTIWNGYYNWSGDYSMTAGTSLVLVMDMAKPDELCVSYAGGQSGQPFSPHYIDLLQYWLRGECVPVALDRARVEKNAESVLRLLPRGGNNSR